MSAESKGLEGSREMGSGASYAVSYAATGSSGGHSRRHVKMTFAFDMDKFWTDRTEAYTRDPAGVETDFNRGATPWIIDSKGEKASQRHAPPSDAVKKYQYVLKLLEADSACQPAVAGQKIKIKEKEREVASGLEVKPEFPEEAALESSLPAKLPSGSCFSILTQAGLRSFSPDLIMAELNRFLMNSELTELIPEKPSKSNPMTVGFSYVPSTSREEEYEFTFRAEGAGSVFSGYAEETLLGNSMATIRFDHEHKLVSGQTGELVIDLPIPAGEAYEKLVEGMSDQRFYYSKAFEALGDFSVSVAVDGKYRLHGAPIKQHKQHEEKNYELFLDRLGETLSASQSVDALLKKSISNDTGKLNPEDFTEHFIFAWKIAKPENRLSLQREYFYRASESTDSLYLDKNPENKKMCRDIRRGIDAIGQIESLISDATFSESDNAHEQRVKFKKLFVVLYETASLEEKFILQWQYRSLLQDPTSTLYGLMTFDVSSLSIHEVKGVPLAHTAVEIDRLFDEKETVHQSAGTRVSLKPKMLESDPGLIQNQFLMAAEGRVSEMPRRKTKPNHSALSSKPLSVIDLEPLVPSLPSVTSPISRRIKIDIAKKTSLLGFCSGLVVAGFFLGGVYGVAAALLACMVIAGISMYVQHKRETARQIGMNAKPATVLRHAGQAPSLLGSEAKLTNPEASKCFI